MKIPFIVAVLAVAGLAVPAHAETESCTEITALPFTITAQGIYCLKQNLNVNLASGNAITVNAGNVTIDFNGWRVNNQAALANFAKGVFAQDRKNVTLRNGFVRGFNLGIHIDELNGNASGSNLVEDMKVSDSATIGITVEGDFSVIRNNRVFNTGGNSGTNAFGIVLDFADDGTVAGNTVSGVAETAFNRGIYVANSNRVHVTGNFVTGINGSTDDAGIYASFSNGVTVTGNRLLNNVGAGETGIVDGSSSNLSCLDNDIGGYATPQTGCDIDNGNRVLFN